MSEVFEYRFRVPASLAAVRAFHGSTSVLRELTPPPMVAQIHEFGALEDGMVARFTLWFGPIPIRWTARHEGVSEHGFTDVQIAGPMATWRHTHHFRALSDIETEVNEHIEYAHPPGLRGLGTRLLFARTGLRALFAYRAFVTRRRAKRHEAQAATPAEDRNDSGSDRPEESPAR